MGWNNSNPTTAPTAANLKLTPTSNTGGVWRLFCFLLLLALTKEFYDVCHADNSTSMGAETPKYASGPTANSTTKEDYTNGQQQPYLRTLPPKQPEPTAVLSPEFCERLSADQLYRRRIYDNTRPNKEFNKYYYLNEEILSRGFVDGKLNPSFLTKMADPNHRLSILTLGGSFTRGHGCGESMNANELLCSWPARLERWWKTYLSPQNMKSDWLHHAEHGFGTVQALQRIGVLLQTHAPDLIIMDFLVNDVAQKPLEQATFAHEALLRTIMEKSPHTQILLMEAGCPDCVSLSSLWFARRRIARYYNIPVVDYAAMVDSFNHDLNHEPEKDRLWPTQAPEEVERIIKVGQRWPNFLPPVNTTQGVCCPLNHPPWPIHQYISDSVAYGLIRLLKSQGCPQEKEVPSNALAKSTFFHPSQLEQFSVCSTPMSSHDAIVEFKKKPNDNAGNGWILTEDRPGRPGWIGTSLDPTNSISFPVSFGEQPSVAITYLRSYASLGTATVTFTSDAGTSETISLDGLWDQQYSLPHSLVFIARHDGLAGKLLSPLKDDGYDIYFERWIDGAEKKKHDYTIEFKLVGGEKFKLLSILSC